MSTQASADAPGLSPGREKLLRLQINSRMAHGAYIALSEWRLELLAEHKRIEAEIAEEERRGEFSISPPQLPSGPLARRVPQDQLDRRAEFAEKRKAAIAAQLARAKQELDTVTEAMERHSEMHEGQTAIAQRLRDHLDQTESRPTEYL